jgi:hypothetical protein
MICKGILANPLDAQAWSTYLVIVVAAKFLIINGFKPGKPPSHIRFYCQRHLLLLLKLSGKCLKSVRSLATGSRVAKKPGYLAKSKMELAFIP